MFVFCRPASSKKRFSPHRKINDEFDFTLFEKAAHLPLDEWHGILAGKSIFLDPAYLRIVEDCTYSKLQCRYVIVYRKNKPCGLIYFQVVDFQAGIFGDLFSRQVEKSSSKRMSIFEKYIDTNREEVLLRLCTCGNNLVSGEHGFVFRPDMPKAIQHDLLLEIIDLIAKEEKLRAGISAVLIKDFYQPLKPGELFEDKKYSSFNVEPNMVVMIPAGITDLQSYTALFSKKYRNRAKAVFRSLGNIEVRELSLKEILLHERTIYKLYEGIFEKAKFKLIKLPPDYFSRTKKRFMKEFTVKGFFSEGELVAFASSFVLDDQVLEAHYIGFEYEKNTAHDLYQNILYTMIDEAIKNGCTCVNLGRTAAEIKTTVGAKAEDLICYIKPQNTISKIIQKPFINFLKPAEWTPRNPFREA